MKNLRTASLVGATVTFIAGSAGTAAAYAKGGATSAGAVAGVTLSAVTTILSQAGSSTTTNSAVTNVPVYGNVDDSFNQYTTTETPHVTSFVDYDIDYPTSYIKHKTTWTENRSWFHQE